MAESRSLRFAATARALGDVARSHGLVVPSFRSPPRRPGDQRTIRRHAGGGATVSIVVRERPWLAVVADMIDGFVAANADAADITEVRDRLWGAIDTINTVDADQPSPPPAGITRLPAAA